MYNNYENMNYYNKNLNNYNNYNSSILEPYQGLMLGNMFKDLYDPYKNYKPKNINPSNEKQYSLLLVQSYGFALVDLNLYLDTNPNDTNAITLFNKYKKLYMEAKANYENKYGPLDITSDSLNANNWLWDNSPWPWEVM